MSTSASAAKPPPGKGWYVLAAVVLLATIAGFTIFLLVRLNGLGASLLQVVVPGEAQLNLVETGSYTIFHEYNSVVDGKVYAVPVLSGLRVSVTSPAGKTLALNAPGGTSRYSFASREGISVFTFEVGEPGTYQLTASYDNGRAEPRTVLSVGSGFVSSIIVTVMIGLLIMFAGIGAAVAIAVVVYLARRRAMARAPGSI
jgi:hypothetical protein